LQEKGIMRNPEVWRYPDTVSFRVTSQEKQKLEKLSIDLNLTKSEFLRNQFQTIISNEKESQEKR
jgi:hypothetical protein